MVTMAQLSIPSETEARFRRVQLHIEELRRAGRTDQAEDVQFVRDLAEQALTAASSKPPRTHLTTGQAATVLGVSDQTIRNWVAHGKLPAERRGVRTMIPREAIEAEIQRSRAPSPLPRTAEEEAARIAWRRQLLAALPTEITARLRKLHNKFEDGEELTDEEQAEMICLEREMQKEAANVLKEVIRRGSKPKA
jgi:excisionase family DNA binding protein